MTRKQRKTRENCKHRLGLMLFWTKTVILGIACGTTVAIAASAAYFVIINAAMAN